MALLSAYVVPHPPLIVPAVGRGQERNIQATIDAYEEVAKRVGLLKPDTIVLSSPHAPLYRDAFFVSTAKRIHGNMGQFGAPQEAIDTNGDAELGRTITHLASSRYALPIVNGFDSSEVMDHATFVPLYFINKKMPGVPVVRVGLSGLSAKSHYNLGRAIAQAVDESGKRAVFIASGDLSHKLVASGPYGFDPAGPVFDQAIEEIFNQGDLCNLFTLDEEMCEDAAECGLRSFWIMAGALGNDRLWENTLLSHEGPFGVGYAIAAIEPIESFDDQVISQSNTEQIDPFVALARSSVEHFVKTGQQLTLPNDTPADLLNQKAGVFVSLHRGSDLRGCIGTIAPTCSCVAEETIRNGVLACSEDPRFNPVTENELDYLSYSVDVLGETEAVKDISDLDPQRYGVIVTKGWNRGLLLPNLEGVNTVQDQLAIAKQKAGLSPFEKDVRLERFEVVRHTLGGEARREL